MKFGAFFLFVLIFSLVFLNTLSDAPVIMGNTTKICVDPTITTNYVGYIFQVNVNITDVTNMWNWTFNLYYNSTLLYCKYVQNFSAPSWGSCTFVGPTIEQSYNATHGRVTASMSATSGSTFNGSMVVANIFFNVTAVTGTCTFDFNGNSVLKDKSGSLIPHDEYDGTFQTGQYTKVAFRFLGVDSGDNGEFQSAQELAQGLSSFFNWQNVTWGKYNYSSYMRLLSNASEAQSSPYYVGQPTKANVIDEVQNFLGATGPGETNALTVRIFCFCDHGTHYYASKDDPNVPALQFEKYQIPDLSPPSYTHKIMNDTQLNDTLCSNDLGSSSCVVAIVDCCYSGDFLNKTQSGRVALTACQSGELSNGWQSTGPPSGSDCWTWFIGNKNAEFGNYSTYGPLGIIGGLFNADDSNLDNWRSAGEVFDFANRTTVEYSSGEKQRTNGGTGMQYPQAAYGVVDGGVPMVMYDKYWSVLCRWMPWGENYMEPTEFAYNAQPTMTITSTGPIGQWGTLGNSPSRVSYSPSNGASQSELLWSKSSLSQIASSAAISPQKIVFQGAENGSMYAFDAQTGGKIWEFDSGAPIESTPDLADGMIFFGTDSGTVYALDEGTGMARWSYQTAGASNISSPAVCNGMVFVCSGGGGGGGCLYALDEASGTQEWNYSTGGSISGSPAASSDTVFIGDSNGMLYALNMSDGTSKFTVPVGPPEGDPPGPIASTPVVADPLVYVTSTNGRVYGINMVSGTSVWHYVTGGPIISSPAVDTDRNILIVGSQDEYLYALNRMTGALLPSGLPVWKTYVGNMDRSSSAISGDGLVYVGTTSNFYCLNETSAGAIVWSYTTSGPVYSSPALTDEHAIVSSYDGTLYCFGPAFPYHDVAILNATASSSYVVSGDNVTVEYVIKNLGNRAETFNVTVGDDNASAIWAPPLYLEPEEFHTETLTLLPGQTVNLSCQWYTIGKAAGNYRITVEAPLDFDSDPSNNAYQSSLVQVIIVGGGGSGRMPMMT